MQSMWFQTELGYAYQRVGNLGEALKKYHEVDKVRREDKGVKGGVEG